MANSSILSRIASKLFGTGNGTVAYSEFEALKVPAITHDSTILHDNAVAAHAVDIVATASMNTEPELFIESGEKVNGAAKKLLYKPNLKHTGDELVYKTVEDFYKGGDSFVVMVGNLSFAPTSLNHIEAQKVSAYRNQHGDVVWYTIDNDDYSGRYVYDSLSGRYMAENSLIDKELVVIKHPSGRSILNSARIELFVLSASLDRNGALIANGGRLTTLLSFKDSVSNDEMAQRIDGVQRTIRSKGYGGILGVTGGENGVDVKEMGMNPRDMDFAALQEYCRREVYLRCGVPLPLVDNSAATDNNMQAAREMLITSTVVPICDLIYSTIGDAIAKREKVKYKVRTNQSAIPEIRSKIVREVKEKKDTGLYTINELRAMLGSDKTDGGDSVLVEARLVPLETLGVERTL